MVDVRYFYDDSYGLRDRLLGDVVTINGISAYDYNADLIDYKPTVATITKDLIKKVGRHTYLINRYSNGDNGITLRFYVGGQNYQQAQINCNKLLYAFQKDIAVVNISDSEFEYVGVVSSYNISYTEVLHYYLLEITMVAVKRLPPIVFDSDSADGVILENEGIIDSGIMICVKSDLSDDEIVVSLNDGQYSVTISNADDYAYHVIDGLNGKVLCGTTEQGLFLDDENENFTGYQNNFINTNLTDFPKLNPGENTITVTGGVDEVIVKYYPIFVI